MNLATLNPRDSTNYFSAIVGNSGISDEAKIVHANLAEAQKASQGFSQKWFKEKLAQELFDAVEDCFENNWDGYNALAVSPIVYRNASIFADFLTPDLPFPEIGVDPDGEISFDWRGGPYRVFGVSIGKNRISYAGLFGYNVEIHGTETLLDGFPHAIAQYIQRVYLKG